MSVQFSITLDEEGNAALEALASTRQRTPAELVQEAVDNYLAYDRWFRAEVQKGIASLDRGEDVELEEVEAMIEARIAAFGKPTE